MLMTTRRPDGDRRQGVETVNSKTSLGLLALTTSLAAADDPAEILDVMTAICPDVLGAELVGISVLEPDGSTLGLLAPWSTAPAVTAAIACCAVDDPLPTRDALRTGRPVVLRTVAERDERYPALAGVDVGHGSLCVVPLLSGRHRVGALWLGWDDPDDMSDDVITLASATAVLCASALHRAMAVGDEAAARRRSDAALARLRALQAVAAELAHSVDVEQAAAIVLESVRTGLGADAGALNLFDESVTTAMQVASLGLERSSVSTWTTWKVRDSLVAQELLRTGLPVLITDAESRRAQFRELDRAGLEQEAWANLLLSSAGTPLGMMSIGWRQPREFDLDDIALLQTLADHLAAAIDRAHLLVANAALLDERTRIAATLQRSLLPAPLPSWPGVTLAAAYEPAELGTEVCGDFYDAFLDDDGSLIIVIGDVAGRGVAAAGLTGMARHTLRALAREMSPPEALCRLNDVLVDAAGTDDLRLLTTGVLCLRRSENGISADISLAGHCLPVLLRGGRAETVGTAGTMLGAFPGAHIGTTTIELEVDDVLLLHTDGVIEARRNGAEFGEPRLLRLLSALSDPRPDETVDHVLNAVRWYRTTVPDDIAVVAVRVDSAS